MNHPRKLFSLLLLPFSLFFTVQSCGIVPAQVTTQTSVVPPTAQVSITNSRILAQPVTPTASKTQEITEIPAASAPELNEDLMIGYPYSPTYVEYFNQINQPSDYVAVGLPGLEFMDGLMVGQKVLMFGSVARLKAYPTEAFRRVDLIGFDLERGAVPQEEQDDLVSTVQEASQFARSKNLKFLLAPVARWTEAYGELLVPYADVIVMQMMRYQSDPVLCPEKIGEFSRKLRTANPNIEIFVQLSTQREETPAQLFACIEAARAEIDGVWIQWHYRAEGSGPKDGPPNFEELQELIGLLRPEFR